MKQKLGPLQKEWVRCLRDKRFKQTMGVLMAIPPCANTGDVLPCCCLGVACIAAEANGVEMQFKEQGANAVILCNGEHCTTSLPRLVQETMRFHDCAASISSRDLNGAYSLIGANDSGATFAEIADFVEANPEAVFTEPA